MNLEEFQYTEKYKNELIIEMKHFHLLFLIFFDTFAALKLGLTEIAKVLIKNKANVNARNLNNETALHFGNIISKDSSSF